MPFSRLKTLLIVFLMSSNGYAYSLKDHQEITMAAAQAILPCVLANQHFSETVQRIVDANLREDLNVLKKWFKYSHFYNPEHDFSSIRLNSRDRILELEKRLSTALSEVEKETLFGKAVHHLQDMSAPPHVVPVNHFWTDGFEKLRAPVPQELAFSSCNDLVEAASEKSLSDLHRELAEETWLWVTQNTITVKQLKPKSVDDVSIPLQFFWSPGVNQKWGSYGLFGNAYGSEWLETSGQLYQASPASYVYLKKARLLSATRATQTALAKLLFFQF